MFHIASQDQCNQKQDINKITTIFLPFLYSTSNANRYRRNPLNQSHNRWCLMQLGKVCAELTNATGSRLSLNFLWFWNIHPLERNLEYCDRGSPGLELSSIVIFLRDALPTDIFCGVLGIVSQVNVCYSCIKLPKVFFFLGWQDCNIGFFCVWMLESSCMNQSYVSLRCIEFLHLAWSLQYQIPIISWCTRTCKCIRGCIPLD